MEWISVKERLPADERHVLVYCQFYGRFGIGLAHIVDAQWWGTIRWNQNEPHLDLVEGEDEVFNMPSRAVTHWMELPYPPKPGASTCSTIPKTNE